jgi:hypothetical protein
MESANASLNSSCSHVETLTLSSHVATSKTKSQGEIRTWHTASCFLWIFSTAFSLHFTLFALCCMTDVQKCFCDRIFYFVSTVFVFHQCRQHLKQCIRCVLWTNSVPVFCEYLQTQLNCTFSNQVPRFYISSHLL